MLEIKKQHRTISRKRRKSMGWVKLVQCQHLLNVIGACPFSFAGSTICGNREVYIFLGIFFKPRDEIKYIEYTLSTKYKFPLKFRHEKNTTRNKLHNITLIIIRTLIIIQKKNYTWQVLSLLRDSELLINDGTCIE